MYKEPYEEKAEKELGQSDYISPQGKKEAI